ncbi:MAG: low molecular weight phosphotyrosine protein phosphatase [Gammaproteobacteria bacterium]
MMQVSVLFVCMGNICRSPTAQGVFQKLIDDENLGKTIFVDSAGTHAYQAGKKPDARAISTAAKRGYKLSKYRARKIAELDFERFDYILAMDDENYSIMLEKCDAQHKNKIKLFMKFAVKSEALEVPDPYYGGLTGFETVLDLIEDASMGLLKYIKQRHI